MPAFPRTSLADLKEGAERFARALPSVAPTLARPCSDPLTERLVEAVRVLGATVLDKASDAQRHAFALTADRCCPWLRRPIPAATIVAFEPPSTGRVVVGPSDLLSSAPIDGVSCTFRPIHEATIGPFRVESAQVEARPGRLTVLRLLLRGSGAEPVNHAIADGISLYVDGALERALQVVFAVTSEATALTAEATAWTGPLRLDPSQITRAELDADSALAPDPDGRPQTFSAFVDAAVCPDKFRFFRLPAMPALRAAPATERLTLSFQLREASLADARLRPEDVRAHCVPVVNLFEAAADPVLIEIERGETPLRVAGLPRRAGGVYAVHSATATAQRGEHPPVPLADARRLGAAATDPRCPLTFSTSFPETSEEDPDVVVTFGKTGGASTPESIQRAASFRVLATNRRLASRIRTGDLRGELPTKVGLLRFSNVVPASPYIPPPQGQAFALRVLHTARVPQGVRDPLATLKDALFQSLPSWVGHAEWIQAQHLRIRGLERLEIDVARRIGARGEVRRGTLYRLVVDEAAFRGRGDLALFGATLGEALARTAPVGSFSDVLLQGRRGTFAATFPAVAAT